MSKKPVFKITDKMFQTLVQWYKDTENAEFKTPPEAETNNPKSDLAQGETERYGNHHTDEDVA